MKKSGAVERVVALLLSAALAAPGCAAARATGVAVAPASGTAASDVSVLADYVQRLPAGAALRVDLTSGKSLRATLMKATERSLVLQRRTRVPEPPVEIDLQHVARVTLDTGNGANLGKAIGVGAAAGAGAAAAIILILIAVFSD